MLWKNREAKNGISFISWSFNITSIGSEGYLRRNMEEESLFLFVSFVRYGTRKFVQLFHVIILGQNGDLFKSAK